MRTSTAALCLLFFFARIEQAVAAEKPVPGKQVEQDYVAVGDKTATARYLLFLPKGYGKSDKQWPLIYFLHGRGESYGPLSLVKKWGPPKIVESKPDFPYIVVSPQCPRKESWKQPRQQKILSGLLEDILKKYRVDSDRVYLTGLSMGGYGSWTLAARTPQKFAAVVPICGGGDPADAAKMKHLPIWVFHGKEDGAVPIKRSREMVEALQKAGSKSVRFTTLEHFGHNSWSAAYASPVLYDWLNRQRVSKNEPDDAKE